VVDSRKNSGVLWVHNDSGDSPRLFALTPAGVHLATYNLPDAPSGDWEDLAVGLDPQTGEHVLYVGDVGDNQLQRESIVVHVVAEPDVSPTQEPVEADATFYKLLLQYPDDHAFDSETLLVDPVTSDIYVVTKVVGATFGVYRKAAPHAADEEAVLDLVAEPTSKEVATYGVTTGGEFSPLGDRIVVRGYGPNGRLWLRDGAHPMSEILATEPCEVTLPVEIQAESVCFSADGSGLYTIPEGDAATIRYTPFVE